MPRMTSVGRRTLRSFDAALRHLRQWAATKAMLSLTNPTYSVRRYLP